jgi:hypothetical protein
MLVKWCYNNNMIAVKNKEEIKEFETLDLAMQWAKQLGTFVTIKGNEFVLVGCFGVDSIEAGKCPDGVAYDWKKRRI